MILTLSGKVSDNGVRGAESTTSNHAISKIYIIPRNLSLKHCKIKNSRLTSLQIENSISPFFHNLNSHLPT